MRVEYDGLTVDREIIRVTLVVNARLSSCAWQWNEIAHSHTENLFNEVRLEGRYDSRVENPIGSIVNAITSALRAVFSEVGGGDIFDCNASLAENIRRSSTSSFSVDHYIKVLFASDRQLVKWSFLLLRTKDFSHELWDIIIFRGLFGSQAIKARKVPEEYIP
jgi:hypothetical protein